MSSDEAGRPVAGAPDAGAPGAGAAPGPDLARAALSRARAAARSRRSANPPRRGGSRGGSPATGPAADPRDPRPLGAAVRELVSDRGWDGTVAEASVLGRWADIVGADVAAHCRPESLVGGRLVLVAESTAWATQLRLLGGTLLAKIATAVGPDVVRSVNVHGPTGPDWRHGPRRVGGGRGPRDTYG